MRQTAFVAAVLFGLAMPVHAATFTVTSDADSGPATLRWAIEQANATPGRDSINFSPSNLDRTISLVSPLPEITDTLNFERTYYFRVTIDGSAAGPAANGLVIAADRCLIINIIVQNFSGDGVDNRQLGEYRYRGHGSTAGSGVIGGDDRRIDCDARSRRGGSVANLITSAQTSRYENRCEVRSPLQCRRIFVRRRVF